MLKLGAKELLGGVQCTPEELKQLQPARIRRMDMDAQAVGLPTYSELLAAMRATLAALEKANPANAADWPAQEAAEKNVRELLGIA
jgi:hypothetical protein